MSSRTLTLLKEGLRYFMGACAGLAADWLVWTAVFLCTGSAVGSQVVSRTAGAVVAYRMFSSFAFKAEGSRNAALRFIAAAAASWGLSVGLVALGSLYLPAAAAKFGADGVTFLVNYVVMKWWVFKAKA